MNEDMRKALLAVDGVVIPYMEMGNGGTIVSKHDGRKIATLNIQDWTPAEVHAFAVLFTAGPSLLMEMKWADERRQEDGT